MQRYTIPLWLANEIAKKSNKELLSALRMWFWLKTHGYPAHFYRRNIADKIPFTLKQQCNHFRTLVEYGIMGRDKNGKYYLRGRRWLFHISEKSSKMAGIVVEPYVTESRESWRDFLCACWILSTQRNIRRFAAKPLVKLASTQSSCGISDVSQHGHPLSLENIAKSHNTSIPTAHRWLKRAESGGHLTKKADFKDMSHLFQASSIPQLSAIKAQLAWTLDPVWKQRQNWLSSDPQSWQSDIVNPSALLLRDGKVVMQMPNLVKNTGVEFRSISNVSAPKRWR